jgi:uncharacterized protein (TIGR00299 family) protein
MRIAYFDCFAGVAGDMTVAALIHAGFPEVELRSSIAALGLTDVAVSTSLTLRSSISATRFHVHSGASGERSHHSHDHDRGNEQGHDHAHNHGHDHHDDHGDSNNAPPVHHHTHGRSHAEIVALIEQSGLPARVKRDSLAVFAVIAAAESRMHAVAIADVHFHEVGAVDSIVDIVGACAGLAWFNIEAVYSSAVRLGHGGTAHTQHGPMPIPAPATLEILRDYPVQFSEFPFELTTPTGAGIIRALSSGTLADETFRTVATGFGAGSKDIPGIANMLRVVIAEIDDTAHDEPLLIETNIDNLDPEIYPYVIERLMEAGAHDAFLIPILMKKGRPGMLLSALVPRRLLEPSLAIIYAETPTLGVRLTPVGRRMLPRATRTVATIFGDVRIKEISSNGAIRRVPEFDECKRIALEQGLALRVVQERLVRELNPMEYT